MKDERMKDFNDIGKKQFIRCLLWPWLFITKEDHVLIYDIIAKIKMYFTTINVLFHSSEKMWNLQRTLPSLLLVIF